MCSPAATVGAELLKVDAFSAVWLIEIEWKVSNSWNEFSYYGIEVKNDKHFDYLNKRQIMQCTGSY